MESLSPELLDAIAASCQGGAERAVQALGDALGIALTASVVQPGTWDRLASPEDFDGPGLLIVLQVGQSAALAILPESSGLLPDWYGQPDADGRKKLAALADQLGGLLLPEVLAADDFSAACSPNLVTAIGAAEVPDGAAWITLGLSSASGQLGAMSLLWPANAPAAVLEREPPPPLAAKPAYGDAANSKVDGAPRGLARPHALPSYSRSLLRIRVPVMVSLATKKQPIGKIVELVPGSLIQFNKSCEETLELEISGRRIALGECVKVGDKFGLRVTSLIAPEERFSPLGD